MEFEALVRMMQASDERHAQDRKAMMMAIAKLYQKQSPEKPAPAAEKEPTPSPARAAKKQTKLTSPKKNAQKKKHSAGHLANMQDSAGHLASHLAAHLAAHLASHLAGHLAGHLENIVCLRLHRKKVPAMTTATTVTKVTTATITRAKKNQVVPAVKTPQ